MENSRKSSCDLAERVADALSLVLPAGSSILLGLSGGIDSVVLLHLLHQLAPRYFWNLSSLHVHHGISPHANDWAAFCADLCARYNIPFQVEHVDIAPLREHGVEAAARKLRHATFDRQPVDFIALAHHQDDQAETLLLQLLRGAGLRGASAMPVIRQRADRPTQLRPLLDVARSELRSYAQQHALQWVEDESNADDAYPRNFMRHRVLPLLEQRFPAYRETLARSARHFAEASELLDQLAQQDAQGALHDGGLDVARLQALSLSRAKNLLRYFLHSLGAPMPQAVQLDDMLQQLCGARQGAAVQISFGTWQLRRYQGKVYAFPALPEPDAEFRAQWCGEVALAFPELGGTLHFEPAIGLGLSLQKLQQAAITVRLRRGAERIRPDSKRPTRTLKNLLQEQGIPPWQRDRLPLLYRDETLVAVPGIGVECAYQAEQEEAGVVLKWGAVA
jgi:tRNA(Ile)-lysidine synthase